MTIVNPGAVSNNTTNVAHKLLVAWVDSAGSALVGPQGQNIPIGAGGVAISAGANSQSSGTINFSNANGVSFGMDGAGNVTATVTPGAAAGIAAVNAGTQTQTSGTLVFSNSNGISFGMSNSSVLTASYTVPTQSVQTQASGNIAGTGFTSTTTGGVVIVGTNSTNGLSLGIPNYITTYVAQTTQTQPAGNIAGAGTTTTTQAGSTLGATQNSNGLSLAVPLWITTYVGQTTQTQAAGNIAGIGTTTTTQGGSTLGATLSTNGLSLAVPLWLTAAAGGGGFTGGVSNIGNTAGNTGTQTGTLVFAGGNNITLSVATAAGGAQTITISGANAGGAQTGISGIADANGTQTAGTLSFANSNGITFGLSTGANTGTITASYTVPATAGLISGLNVSGGAGNSRSNVTGMTFNNANGMTFGVSTGANVVTVTGSYTVPTVPALSAGVSTGGNTLGNTGIYSGQVVFAGGNNITLSVSSGAAGAQTITISGANAGGAQTGISGIIVSNTTYTSGTVSFSNANGISFGSSAGQAITASYTVPTVPALSFGVSTGGNTAGNTGTFSGQAILVGSNNITLSVGTAAGGAQTITVSGPTLTQYFSNTGTTFNGANVSGSLTINTSGLQVSLSVAAQSNQTVGLYALGNTTQNSSTTLDARTISFNGLGAQTVGYSNGSVQLSVPATSSISGTGQISVSVNGSTISIGAASYGTLSYWDNGLLNGSATTTANGLGSVVIQGLVMGANFSASALRQFISGSWSTSSNSSYAGTITARAGMYTLNGSTLSLASSGSQTYVFTQTSSNSASILTGIKGLTMPLNLSMTPGNYWLALWSSTATANANWVTLNNVVAAEGALTYNGNFGVSTNASNQVILGGGLWSTTSTNLPGSIALTAITGSIGNIAPYVNLYNASA